MAEFVTTQREDGGCTLTASGEVDIATVEEFLAVAGSCLESGSDLLEIDLSGVTFIDSSGLGALVRLRNEGAERDVRITLVAVPAKVARLLELTGLAEAFLDPAQD